MISGIRISVFSALLLTLTVVCVAQVAEERLITFDKYHTVEEIESFLERTSAQHKDLARLVEIGKSRGGRRILALEINNPDTGRAEDKPGFYVDGNIHGGEVLAGEAATFFIGDLLDRYGSDPEITTLVDRLAIYVVPLVNPDGRAISVDTPENHRWNIRPTDQDGDGRVDEDPPEDLDGDGRILRMRVLDPRGRWKISPDDPRLMVRRDPAETGEEYYRIYTEGLDNDDDGRYNEDIVGGVDVNRNFPANWHPAQFASGPYPLSEPESRALVEYITSRPNIAAIHTYHTSGGLILRFPTLADQDWNFPQADLEDYRNIAEEGSRITGYDNYAYEKKKIVDLMNPGHGVFNDWASKVFGVTAFTTELWKHAIGQGRREMLAWNDRKLGGRGFVDWYPYDHPQLGRLELGGWDRWSISSPPEHMIEEELRRNQAWVVSFAQRLPRLEFLEAEVSEEDQGLRKLSIRVANVGWMPTATEYAAEILKTAQPVRAKLVLQNASLVEGDASKELGVLPGARGPGLSFRELSWKVRITDSARPSWAEVTASSQKAGTVRRRVNLNGSDR